MGVVPAHPRVDVILPSGVLMTQILAKKSRGIVGQLLVEYAHWLRCTANDITRYVTAMPRWDLGKKSRGIVGQLLVEDAHRLRCTANDITRYMTAMPRWVYFKCSLAHIIVYCEVGT